MHPSSWDLAWIGAAATWQLHRSVLGVGAMSPFGQSDVFSSSLCSLLCSLSVGAQGSPPAGAALLETTLALQTVNLPYVGHLHTLRRWIPPQARNIRCTRIRRERTYEECVQKSLSACFTAVTFRGTCQTNVSGRGNGCCEHVSSGDPARLFVQRYVAVHNVLLLDVGHEHHLAA